MLSRHPLSPIDADPVPRFGTPQRPRARWRLPAAVVLLSLLPALSPAGAASAAPALSGAAPAGAAPGRAAGAAPRTVTLITGDRVTVMGQGVSVEPAKGRTGVPFLNQRVGGEQHVVPADALPLLRSGRLDPRLFDITTLLDFGYDARPKGLPLIVTRPKAAPRSAMEFPGLAVTRELPAVNAVAADAGSGTALWRSLTTRPASAGTKVWLDGRRRLLLDTSVPLVGAPAAWKAGYDGKGVKVAVLDTGADATHPDLVGRVVAERNFTPGEAEDTIGHGTHVASTVAGSGAAAGGRYRGVAPGASLLIGKICIGRECPDSLILEGMQWAAEQGADVVNLSFGDADRPGIDPVEQAVGNLTERYGTLFVAAAGNSGEMHPSIRISSPSSADAALSVAATTKTDEFAGFSSRGPRPGDLALKPDIAAPGQSILAARSKDMWPPSPDQKHVSFTGTSMSAPHVAGAAAILAQQHPDWTPAQLKAHLMGTAKPLSGVEVTRQGAGRLDVARAVGQTVTAEPGSVSFGTQLWPHDGPAVPKPVTYVNHGKEPVALKLSTDAKGPDGKPVPAAGFTANPSSVTVPAGGRVKVTLSADPKAIGAVYGHITGHLRATAGDTVIGMPFSLENEQESYDLTIKHLDRGGAPATGFLDTLFRMDKPGIYGTLGPGKGDTVRVPKGVYTVNSVIGQDQDNLTTLLVQQRLEVTSAQTIVADARQAEPVTVTPPGTDLQWRAAAVGAGFSSPGNSYNFLLQATSFDKITAGRMGPDEPVKGFRSFVRGTVLQPGPGGTDADSQAVYHMAWPIERRMITGFSKKVEQRDLATVKVSRAINTPGGTGRSGTFPSADQGLLGNVAPSLSTRLPFHRTEHYTTEDGVRWQAIEFEFRPDFQPASYLESAPVAYRAGRTYAEKWNYAVIGPTLPREGRPMVRREGDILKIDTAFSGDGSGRYGVIMEDARTLAVLYRNGVEIGRRPFAMTEFAVPPEPSDYRLHITSERRSGELSTRVDVAWTFRSGHADEGEPALLPLWAVRYVPPVDDHGTAEAGREIELPVITESQPGGDAGRLRDLTVQVSVDDGKTWQDAQLKQTPGGSVALVRHPPANGFVSLRATAEDGDGNKLEQTIIRAYRIATRS
ncbi:peptidase S8 [Actinomadura soli]|uniref:Peptidase S8 n=1 Tax=Actinomadura soli TaxID=2508997 RepID=A0A5C4J7G5_9ACTN|nr:S8 family serine peptidase [Actinomadura soli]TMQ93567.1 peptidase S8 [Actinomadura soli]